MIPQPPASVPHSSTSSEHYGSVPLESMLRVFFSLSIRSSVSHSYGATRFTSRGLIDPRGEPGAHL